MKSSGLKGLRFLPGEAFAIVAAIVAMRRSSSCVPHGSSRKNAIHSATCSLVISASMRSTFAYPSLRASLR